MALLLSLNVAPTHAEQNIIEGDVPAGLPFDGSSGRASMYDLFEVAEIGSAIAASSAKDSDDKFMAKLAGALSDRGYPGVRIVLTPRHGATDQACSIDDRVEARVDRQAEPNEAAIMIASQNWVSAGRSPRLGGPDSFAIDCY